MNSADRKNPETIYITERTSWRAWLAENFDKKDEVWLIFPKKASGMSRISYSDAVEEALCFGWIDSTIRSFDENSSIQRFSPRRSGSSFSQPNKERLGWLLQRGLVHPSVLEAARKAVEEVFAFPPDILAALEDDALAWRNYLRFSESYRRIRVAYIDSARKRPEEFEKRLSNFLRKTRENKLIRGFGGIEKYY